MPKNILFTSLKESFSLIWKNKFLLFLLMVSQVLFFIIFFTISYHYQTKIIENANTIFDYLSQLKLDEAAITSNILQQKSILGEDPLMISRNFNEIVKNFRIYLIYAFILLVVFTSINWTITIWMVFEKNFSLKRKNFFINIFLKNIIILSFYLGLIFLFFFSLFNISLTEFVSMFSQILTKYVPFFIISLILSYFMFVSLSLLHKIDLKNLVQKTLIIGIKKAHYILAVYFVNIFLFSVSIFLLYYFIEKNLFVLLLSMILMIISFIFGRIFLVMVVEKLG